MPPKRRREMDQEDNKEENSNAFALIMNKPKKADSSDSNSNFLATSSDSWRVLAGTVLARREHRISNGVPPKVAAFDLDGTLVRPKKGRVFPIDEHDWDWAFPEVPHKLKQLSKDGYDIVIFTNQKNMHVVDNRYKGLTVPQRLALITKKIDMLQKNLNIPLSAYVALAGDVFRKPARGMFDLMLDAYHELHVKNPQTNNNADSDNPFASDDLFAMPDSAEPSSSLNELIDMKESFYVGDAAGRASCKGVHKDHSDADRAFAMNTGIRFSTPETFFQNKPSPNDNTWEFKSLPVTDFITMPTAQSLAQYPLLANAPVSTSPYEMAQNMYGIIKQHYAKLPKPHVIMFVGPPASGKTSLYRNVFPDYVWVNQDTLKTLPAVLKSITAALNSGHNVVVDRTHGTVDARLKVMEVIKPRVPAVPVHVLQLDVPKELSIRMNLVRAHVSKGQGTAVPTIVFHTYYKSFEPPQEKEGFASIEKLPWIPYLPEWNSNDYKPIVPASLSLPPAAIETDEATGLGAVSLSRKLADYFFQHVEGK